MVAFFWRFVKYQKEQHYFMVQYVAIIEGNKAPGEQYHLTLSDLFGHCVMNSHRRHRRRRCFVVVIFDHFVSLNFMAQHK